MLRFFLMNLGFMSVGVLIGLLVKRTGLAVFAYLAYSFMLEPIIRGVHVWLLKHESWNWYPWNVFEDLVRFPIADLADEFLEENGFSMYLDPRVAIFLSIGFILLFGWLSLRRLQRSDL